MSDDRIRVNITLSQVDYDYLSSCADVVGLSITRLAYLAINEGLPGILQKEKQKAENVRNLKAAKAYSDLEKEHQPVKEKRGRGRPKKAK